MILLAIALVLTAAAASLLGRAFASSRVRASRSIAQISSYGYASTQASPQEDSSPVQRTIDSLAGRIGSLVRLQASQEQQLRRMLVSAGSYRVTPRRFMGYRLLATIVLPLVVAWIGATSPIPPPALLAGVVIAAILGWRLPLGILIKRRDQRLTRIERSLPELVDLLVVTIEAGLGFAGAMQLAAQSLRGPLGDELRLTLQEQSMGLSMQDALRNLLERADTPSMRSLVRAITQGETLGVSIGQIMRDLAREMRLRRRQNAEEQAQKAPVKMLFPLIFLILPALFIVLLGPAVFRFMDTFGH